jgi:hypothetical protein
MRGTVTPRKPLDFAPRTGAIILHGKRAFCGFYLGGPWGLKNQRKTTEGAGWLVWPLNGHPPMGHVSGVALLLQGRSMAHGGTHRRQTPLVERAAN